MFALTGTAAFAQARPLCNLLLFKLAWVLLVVWQEKLLLPAFAIWLLSLCLHPTPRHAAVPVLQIALTGLLLDLALTLTGVFVFPRGMLPLWLVLLWLVYGQALTLGLAFLQRLPLWAQAACGAACGAGSYGAGLYFGAVQFGPTLPLTTALLTMLWALLLPLHLRLARGWCRVCEAKPPGLLLPLLVLALALHPGIAMANRDTHQLSLIGQATFRFMFWQVYDARLYAEESVFRFPDSVPFRLELVYRRDFSRAQILAETIRQWRLQELEVPEAWQQTLALLLPDVAAGDTLGLHITRNNSAELLHNGTILGIIEEPAFALGIAGIWLAANTTRPDFRQQLLGAPP